MGLEAEAEALHAEEKWADGLALADRAVEESASSELAHRLRFIALRNLNRNDEAIAAARRSIELAPREANAHYLLATVLFENSADEEALKSVDRAIELEPHVPHYQRFRIRVLMMFDKTRVEAVLNQLEQLTPPTADTSARRSRTTLATSTRRRTFGVRGGFR